MNFVCWFSKKHCEEKKKRTRYLSEFLLVFFSLEYIARSKIFLGVHFWGIQASVFFHWFGFQSFGDQKNFSKTPFFFCFFYYPKNFSWNFLSKITLFWNFFSQCYIFNCFSQEQSFQWNLTRKKLPRDWRVFGKNQRLSGQGTSGCKCWIQQGRNRALVGPLGPNSGPYIQGFFFCPPPLSDTSATAAQGTSYIPMSVNFLVPLACAASCVDSVCKSTSTLSAQCTSTAAKVSVGKSFCL